MVPTPARAAFKGAIERFQQDNPKPLAIRNMPFAEALQAAVVDLDLEERRLSAHFMCGPEYIQGVGAVQGGILAAMLDLSMAFLCLAELPAQATCATAQLNVHYLRPAFPGPFRSEAQIEKSGKRVMFSRATLFPVDSDKPVASATAVFTVLGE